MNLCHRELSVIMFSGTPVRFCCIFSCVERAQVFCALGYGDVGVPFARTLVEVHAFVSASIIFCFAAVTKIFTVCGWPYVGPTIAFSFSVVDKMFGPLACHPQIGEPMGQVVMPVYSDGHIAPGSGRSGFITFFDPAIPGFVPEKFTRLRHISKKPANIARRQIVALYARICFAAFSHSILLRSAWSEAVEGVTSAFLPRFYSREAT
jgi:hypothetical protein